MATLDINTDSAPGKLFITKRPSLHDLLASWMSPVDQPIEVSFEVSDRHIDGPWQGDRECWMERIAIRRLVRDEDRETIWFGGEPATIIYGRTTQCAGYIELKHQPGFGGLLFDTGPSGQTGLELGDLPAIRVERAVTEAAEMAQRLLGDEGLGIEIAHRVIRHFSKDARRIGAACPECGAPTSEGTGGRPHCDEHGSLQNGAACLVAFAPSVSKPESD